MAPRVSQQTRSILNAIEQLQRLQTSLRRRSPAQTAGENLKLRKVALDIAALVSELDRIAGRMVARSGGSVEETKQKLAAESAKRRSGQLGAETPCDPVRKTAGPNLAGCMIALYLDAEVAKEVAVKGGEAANRLHLTVVYFEQAAADRSDWNRAGEILRVLAEAHPSLRGVLNGTGRFIQETGEVALAVADIPGLEAFRDVLVEQLELAGFPVSKKHGGIFKPHVTLAYTEPDEEFPDTPLKSRSVSVEFPGICMVQGEKKIVTAPFKAPE